MLVQAVVNVAIKSFEKFKIVLIKNFCERHKKFHKFSIEKRLNRFEQNNDVMTFYQSSLFGLATKMNAFQISRTYYVIFSWRQLGNIIFGNFQNWNSKQHMKFKSRNFSVDFLLISENIF